MYVLLCLWKGKHAMSRTTTKPLNKYQPKLYALAIVTSAFLARCRNTNEYIYSVTSLFPTVAHCTNKKTVYCFGYIHIHSTVVGCQYHTW